MVTCELCREAVAEHPVRPASRGTVMLCTYCIKIIVKYFIERMM